MHQHCAIQISSRASYFSAPHPFTLAPGAPNVVVRSILLQSRVAASHFLNPPFLFGVSSACPDAGRAEGNQLLRAANFAPTTTRLFPSQSDKLHHNCAIRIRPFFRKLSFSKCANSHLLAFRENSQKRNPVALKRIFASRNSRKTRKFNGLLFQSNSGSKKVTKKDNLAQLAGFSTTT